MSGLHCFTNLKSGSTKAIAVWIGNILGHVEQCHNVGSFWLAMLAPSKSPRSPAAAGAAPGLEVPTGPHAAAAEDEATSVASAQDAPARGLRTTLLGGGGCVAAGIGVGGAPAPR